MEFDHLAAQHDVGMQMIAAQVEKSVFETDLFRIVLFAEHRHRQFAGRSEYLDLVDIDFDLAGRQVRILGTGGTAADLAVNADHPLRAQRLGKLEGLAVGIGHDLREAIVIAQIDEQQPAMVADAMAPARETDDAADIAVAKLAAGM